jgi:crossover junction endodeoxyribonuclease RuvC
VTVLGIDPGLAVTGYGVLRNGLYVTHGTISSSPDRPLSERIALIGREFERLLRRHKPDACAVETLFFKSVGARSVILAAQLRGGLFISWADARFPSPSSHRRRSSSN